MLHVLMEQHAHLHEIGGAFKEGGVEGRPLLGVDEPLAFENGSRDRFVLPALSVLYDPQCEGWVRQPRTPGRAGRRIGPKLWHESRVMRTMVSSYSGLMRWSTWAGIFTLAALLAGLQPGSAAAQSGVGADPRSPGGREYDIPLEQVRRDARGSNGSSSGGSRGGANSPSAGGFRGTGGPPTGGRPGAASTGSDALFGAGISSSVNGASRGAGTRDVGGGTTQRDGKARGATGGAARGPDGSRIPADRLSPPADRPPLGSSPLLGAGTNAGGSWWPAMIAAGVLGAGATVGLMIARRRRRET